MNSRQYVRSVIREQGVHYDSSDVVLANGGRSPFFFDVKQAFSKGGDLLLLAEAMDELARDNGIEYNIVGGMELGAVPIAITMALSGPAGNKWFVLRKRPKGRGTNKLIEGYLPNKYDNVLIVEDVVTTGTTLVNTVQHLQQYTHVVGAISVIDRSVGKMQELARDNNFTYAAIFTSQDLL